MNSKNLELAEKLNLLNSSQRKEVTDFIDFIIFKNEKKTNKKKITTLLPETQEEPFIINKQKVDKERFSSKEAWALTKNWGGSSLSELVVEERRVNL